MSDEPKLSRVNSEGTPLTGAELVRLWVLVGLVSVPFCASVWLVFHYVFGWL